MLYRCLRRQFRNHFGIFLIILSSFLIISFIIHLDIKLIKPINRDESSSRLFCVLIQTQPTQERFLYVSNITWARNCYKIGIIRYKKLQRPDEDSNIPQSPYHVNLWTRILSSIRQTINSDEILSNKDILIIVPALTFVFPEKVSLLLQTSNQKSNLPLFIIYQYQDINAYILNGHALNLIYNTELIDKCLQQSYPSARESHLWKCVKDFLDEQEKDSNCKSKNCFIHYHHSELTLEHIKNGSCLQTNLPLCKSIALFYPLTFNDFITLEFFKYRLKIKSSHDL